MSLTLSGIGISRGIAIGKAHIIHRGAIEVLECAIPPKLIEDEVERFLNAIRMAREQLEAIRQRVPENTRADIGAFIDTHLLMLDDDSLVITPVEIIRELGCNAEWALKLQRDAFVDVFEQMDDAYLRTRLDDIDHVINRIQRILLDSAQGETHVDSELLQNSIALTDDLTPAETVLLEHLGISALATEYGGPLSHTAILARSVELPAVVGAHSLLRFIKDGETIILDGILGVIIASPDEKTLAFYRNRQKQEQRRRLELARLADTPAVTLDKVAIKLMANIELPEDIDAVRRENASGVGLYRTEFLYMNRPEPPGEEEQFECYVSVIKALGGRPLTIRTLDIGADKQTIDTGGARCRNPALGLRAIRLCLRDLALFRPQLRAILRASAHGPVRMMIPMLSNTQELHQVLGITETRIHLQDEQLAYAPDMEIGGMIEVPAAALIAPSFARLLDFMSIGTNDLIQYTLAIDRVDDEVNYLYDPLHPAVLRLIKMVIDAGQAAGIPVAMCGEMAGDPRYTRLLLGMGLSEFSMHHTSLQEVKSVINCSSIEALNPHVQELLASSVPECIPGLIEAINDATG